MKRLLYILPSLFVLIVCSCDMETSENGDLDGMWHLVEVDTLATQGVDDMDGKRIYWSFQKDLLQLDDKTGENYSVLYRFRHEGNTMALYDPYLYDRENGDKPIDNLVYLTCFGVNELDETFVVESLDGGKMVLRSVTLRLRFRKM